MSSTALSFNFLPTPENDIFEQMVNQMPAIIWVSDIQAKCIFRNKKWFDFTGDVSTSKASELGIHIHPEDIERYLTVYKNAFKQKKPFQIEYRLQHKSGKYYWVNDSGKPFYKKNGNFGGYIGISTNISIWKETKESVYFYANVLHNVRDCVIVTDLDEKIIYWSAGAKYIFGYSKKEAIGKHISFLLYTRDRLEIERNYKKILNGKSINVVWLGKTKSGKVIWLDTKTTQYKNENSEVIGFIGVSKDITKEKRIEQENKIYKERLEEAQEAGGIGVYEWNLKTNEVWRSGHEEILFEFNKKKITDNNSLWNERVLPEDFKNMKELMGLAIKNKIDLDSQFRIKTKDGAIRWIKTKGKIFYENGKPERLLGINYDITDRKQLEDILHYKEHASRILSSSLDYKTTLQAIATLSVPKIADWCGIDMLNEDGKIEQFVVVHKNKEKIAVAKDFRKKIPLNLSDSGILSQVIQSGKPVLYQNITPQMVNAAAKTREHRKILQTIGFSSAMIIPLKVQGKSIGVIELISAESKRHYTKENFEIAKQLGSRASLAIENAKLYDEVEKEQKRLTILLSHVPGIVWEAYTQNVSQKSGKIFNISFINNYAEKMLKYSLEEWYTTPNMWLKVIHPDDRIIAAEKLEQIFKETKGGVMRYRCITKDERILWVETQVNSMNSNGHSVGIRAVTMDITQRVELEKRKDDFISMASHELKTPVTSAKVFAQILEKRFNKAGNIESAKLLQRVSEQLDKLSELVKELLDVSKIQRGKLLFKKEKFNLSLLVKETIKDIQPITNHKITLKHDKGTMIIGDKDRIHQVLVNLITNAIRYSPEETYIELAVDSDAENIIVSVKDHGVGIAKDQKEKIFERFYQAESPSGQTYPGLGLGLYISSEIVKEHKGKIWVESSVGKGSTFFFTLPK